MELQETSNDTAVYCPQVKADHIPKKNQEFQTLEDVKLFYTSYAQEGGFIIRSWTSRKKDGVVVRMEYVCSKEGTSQITGKKRCRNKTREGCKARLAVVKATNDKYTVTIFVEGHNHPLTTPRRKHLLKCHREVTMVHRSLTEQLSAVNVATCKQFDFLGVHSGGLENIGCTQQDIYNYKRDCRNEVKRHDGDMLHEYFLLEKEKKILLSFSK